MSTSQQVINDVVPRTQIISSNGQTVFDTNWTADVGTDINVYARSTLVPADDTTQLVDPSDYTVSFIGSAQTVRVTFLVGRQDLELITIVRNTPSTRLNFYTNTNFTPSMLNQSQGVDTLVDQQNKMYDKVLTPRYNLNEILFPWDTILPKLGALESWRMNSTATAIEAISYDGVFAPSNASFWVSQATSELNNEVNLGSLSTGLLMISVAGGYATPSIASSGIDYWAPGNALTRSQAPVNPHDVINKDYFDTHSGGTPGGSNNNMQYNNNGSFGGDPNFNTDGLGNFVINGSYTVNGITYPTSDGTAGQAIVTDGSGNLSFATVGGGGGSPGGANGQLQFNNSGSFGGTTDITYSTTGGKFLKWDDLPNFRVGYNSVTGGYGTYTQGYNIDNEMYSDSDLVFVGESMLVQYSYNTIFVSNTGSHRFNIGSGSISSYDLLFTVTESAGYTAAGIFTGFIDLKPAGGGGTINIGANVGTKDTVRINGILYPDTDGTAGQVMTTDGDGNLSFATVGGGGGITWNEATGTTQAITPNNGYIANNGSEVVFTLPATAAVGTQIGIIGEGAGGWKIEQNSGQSIQIGSVATTTGVTGSISSTNRYDSLHLVCVVANTKWTVFGGPQSAGIDIE